MFIPLGVMWMSRFSQLYVLIFYIADYVSLNLTQLNMMGFNWCCVHILAWPRFCSVSNYECLCNTNADISFSKRSFKWLIWNGRDYLKRHYFSVLVTYSNWSQIRSRHWRIQRSMLYGYQIKLCIIWFIAIGKVHWL